MIFIDGNSLFHGAKNLGFEIDYHALLKVLVGKDELMQANFYTVYEKSSDRHLGFIHWMTTNGFKVFTKATEDLLKAKVDVEISSDMLVKAQRCDKIILVSGNKEYAYPCKLLGELGVRVVVANYRSSVSSNLLTVVDEFIDLEACSNQIRKIEASPASAVAEVKPEVSKPRRSISNVKL